MFKNLFVPKPITLSSGAIVTPKRSITPFVLLILFVLIMISGDVTGFKMSLLIKRGDNFFIMFGDMFPPDVEYIDMVIRPMIDTISMSILGTLIGGAFALPVSFIVSSNINTNKVSLWIVRILLSALRTIPVLIYALIFTYIFGIGTLAGTTAIAVFTFSIATKMIYEQIETVDMGPFEALQSTGANKIKSFRMAIIPQIIAYYFSTVLYNFEMNVRSAAILGYVGAGGIGLLLDEKLGWREYDRVGIILLVLLFTVIAIESTSRTIRKRLG